MTGVRDFSLAMLEQLLLAFKGSGYRFTRFDEYYRNRDVLDRQKKIILFRHDVDRYPRTALATAQLEASHGLYGTYYFRTRPWTFKPPIFKAIADLGHEIGYHYECLPDSGGDFAKAAGLFRESLAKFRMHVPVVTASMHSRPLSNWDGRLLWERYTFDEFGLLGEAYRSVDHYRFVYLADSGRNWNVDRNVIWDTVQGTPPPRMENGTLGFIDAIRAGKIDCTQLLIHPNRWPQSLPQWILQTLQDTAINKMKNAARMLKKRRKGTASQQSERRTIT